MTGFRVGWLDELPTAAPEKKEESKPKKTAEQKAEAVFQEAWAATSPPIIVGPTSRATNLTRGACTAPT
jgi:hypothetical protein